MEEEPYSPHTRQDPVSIAAGLETVKIVSQSNDTEIAMHSKTRLSDTQLTIHEVQNSTVDDQKSRMKCKTSWEIQHLCSRIGTQVPALQ